MQPHAKVAIYSCLVNGTFMGIKYGLGILSGSLALRADAVHSLADVISSLTIFVGIVISARKTKTFPEGLYKVENLVALFSSFFIFFAAFKIAAEAIQGETMGPIRHTPIVVAGIAVIIVIAYLFSRYELKVGLQVGSPSLVADAKHVSTDLLSSVVILLAVLGHSIGISIDRYVALFVAFLVGRMGWSIMIESVKVLLDATLDNSTLDGIRRVLTNHPDITDVVSIGGRSSGRYKFVEITLRLETRLLREAHDLTAHLEEEIVDQWPDIDKILIHYEPATKNHLTVAVPLAVVSQDGPAETARLADHFGEARFFALLVENRQTGETAILRYLENPFWNLVRQKGVKVAELLAEHGVDQVISRQTLNGKGAGYALDAAQLERVETEAETLAGLLQNLSETRATSHPLR